MSTTTEWTNQSWMNPPSIYRSAPFWAWNDRLSPQRLCQQIQWMHEAGMGGFFMHSRYGLKTEYLGDEWFQCVSACVEKARQLDMKAYLYDEDRWPSGTAGGIVTRANPSFGLHLLVACKDKQAPGELDRLGNFAVKLDQAGAVTQCRALEEGQEPGPGQSLVSFAAGVAEKSPWYNDAPYLDTLNAEAVAEYIHVTHQAYADRYGKDFGGVIPAIFTDEPNYSHGTLPAEGKLGQLPWTGDLPMQFKQRRGYDLRDHLVELFFPVAGAPFSRVRHDYYRTVTELYVENFSAQIGQWCQKHNLALTGHYLCEESLALQVGHIGAAMPHYEHQQWPGIDILCDRISEISTTKQCSSVAAQLDRRRVLSELYGCTGWDWPLKGHKFNAGWQYVLGVNFRCPHLSWYSLAGGAKRDYPASIFPHSPWWKYYKLVEDYFARLSLALTQGKPVRDVLLLHPIETAWGLYLHGHEQDLDPYQQPFTLLLRQLLDEHYDYDLADESLLAKYGKVTGGGGLAVGQMEYRLLLVPPTLTLRSTTVAILKRFLAAGGQVVFVGRTPELIDGQPGAVLTALLEQATHCGQEPEVVKSTLENLLPRRVSVTEDGRQAHGIWTMLRQVTSGKSAGNLLLVQSIDRKQARKVHLSVQGRRPVVLWDAVSGKRVKVESKGVGGRADFDLELPPTGSALLSLGLRVPSAVEAPPPTKVVAAVEAHGPWKSELSEPNVLTLDYCRYRTDQGEFSQPVPVLRADEKIRAHFGLPKRSAGGNQPWYLAATGRADRAVRGRCEMKFAFHVTDAPASLQVALERPEDFEIVLNGKTVPNVPTGWWLGEDEQTVELTSGVRSGDNELLLRFDYRSDMELEDLHLVGPFGVGRAGMRASEGRIAADNAAMAPSPTYSLVKPVSELSAGSWVGQGLDFYGAAVNYRLAVPEQVQQAAAAGKRIRLSLPEVKCTCAAVHVGKETFVLPWPPMSADITEALAGQVFNLSEAVVGQVSNLSEITVEVIGGRHNSMGPLHVPWLPWTGPGEFDPDHKQWTDEYLFNDHGLLSPPVFEILE